MAARQRAVSSKGSTANDALHGSPVNSSNVVIASMGFESINKRMVSGTVAPRFPATSCRISTPLPRA